jgi:hypothetical protein
MENARTFIEGWMDIVLAKSPAHNDASVIVPTALLPRVHTTSTPMSQTSDAAMPATPRIQRCRTVSGQYRKPDVKPGTVTPTFTSAGKRINAVDTVNVLPHPT